METTKKSPIPLWLIFLIGIIAISFSSIFIKLSTAPVSISGMYRLLFTNLLMLPFIWKHIEEIKRIKSINWIYLVGSGVALGLHFLLWMASLRYTSVASSTVLMTLEPILVLAGAYVAYREKTTAAAMIGIAIAVGGAMMVGWKDMSVSMSGNEWKGDLLSLLGTVAVAVHMLLGQKLSRSVAATPYSFIVFFVAALSFAVFNLAQGYSFIQYEGREWGLFLLLALVPTLFGHVLFNWSLQFVNAASVSTAVLGEPVGAALLAWMLLGEGITFIQAIACCLLLAGVWIFLKTNRVTARPASSSAK